MNATTTASTGRWTPRRIAIWTAVSLLGAVAWGVLALARGESVNAVWLIVAALCSLSVSGLFVNGSQLVVAGSSLVAGRGGPSWGQGGAARASRDDDLDAAEGCRRLKQR